MIQRTKPQTLAYGLTDSPALGGRVKTGHLSTGKTGHLLTGDRDQ
jgi:hypothetical protein